MELRTLRYFLAVAQAKTISAAAEALHVTQPTLSRQMQELEEELGKTRQTEHHPDGGRYVFPQAGAGGRQPAGKDHGGAQGTGRAAER